MCCCCCCVDGQRLRDDGDGFMRDNRMVMAGCGGHGERYAGGAAALLSVRCMRQMGANV